MATSPSSALGLYRSMMRHGLQIHDYNFRSYALRRVKTGFQQGRELSGKDAEDALKEAREQLAVLKRQAMISQLYPSAKSVMEDEEY